MDINRQFTLNTALYFFVICDPEFIKHRTNESEWWSQFDINVDEVTDGRMAVIPAEFHQTIRITTLGQLSSDEKDRVIDQVGPLGVKIVSNHIYCGGAEALPQNGIGFLPSQAFQYGIYIKLPNGEYNLQFYAIKKLSHSKTEIQLADIVVMVTPRTTVFVPTPRKVFLDFTKKQFLFPSERNQKLMT